MIDSKYHVTDGQLGEKLRRISLARLFSLNLIMSFTYEMLIKCLDIYLIRYNLALFLDSIIEKLSQAFDPCY
jgi:hypothetical protein